MRLRSLQEQKTLILPDNKGIKLLALTVTSPQTVEVKPLQPLYDNFQNNDAFKLITKQE
jgi:hypothetical protein